MEIHRAEFRCAEARFSREDSPARLPLVVAIRNARARLSPVQAFVEWRACKWAYAYRPKHRRREKKRELVWTISQAGAARGPRYDRNRRGAIAR